MGNWALTCNSATFFHTPITTVCNSALITCGQSRCYTYMKNIYKIHHNE